MKIYNSPEELIGGTPLLRLEKIEKKHALCAKLLGKLEFFNPTGSAKDRAAKYMLDDAEARGIISKGAVIIEPTSGNTGIGLAALAAVRGYRAIIVMPDSMSEERIMLMRAYGADVVLTEGALGMSGAIAKAEELHKNIPNSFIPQQFDNPANTEAHRETTGPELYRDTDGEIDIVVAGIGTGGTASGIGEFLKSVKPEVKIIGVEPKDSPLISRGTSGAHKIQGIGANFIPSIFNRSVVDEVIAVGTEAAFECAKELGRELGLLVGISSGAALSAAIEVASREENRGKTVAVILVDGGSKYLSSGLYS